MRILSILLLTTSLFLAFKPGVDLLLMHNLSEKSCCIDIDSCTDTLPEDIASNEKEDNSCDGNFCNPFQVCGSCFLLCLNMAEDKHTKQGISTQQQFSYEGSNSSLFISDFWQPPEWV